MIHITSNNINSIQINLLDKLLTDGQKVKVDNHITLELFPVALQLTKIRRRCTTIPERKWNIYFALGELCWHLTGSREPELLSYYTKNWYLFKDERNNNLTNCYGYKIFNGKDNLWDEVKNVLQNDKHSRKAIIYLAGSGNNESYKPALNNPCTNSLQFLIRDNKLHLIVNMRSNDIIWGLPNDAFVFTMLQELMAIELNVGIGSYSHFIGSLHLYERHFDLASRILKSPNYNTFEMPKMDSAVYLNEFLNAEVNIRRRANTSSIINSSYWNGLLDLLKIKYYCGNNNYQDVIDLSNDSLYKILIDNSPFTTNCSITDPTNSLNSIFK